MLNILPYLVVFTRTYVTRMYSYITRMYAIRERTGVNSMWIINNSLDVIRALEEKQFSLTHESTSDFCTLYTSLPHTQFRNQLHDYWYTHLFLHTFEYDFMIKTMKQGITKAIQFSNIFRYIDDLFSINNVDFGNYISAIYPSEFQLTDTSTSSTEVCYLDTNIRTGSTNTP